MADVDENSVANELRDAAERMVADRSDHACTRRLCQTLPGYDETLLASFAELGWLAVLVPEDAGGIGLGLAEMAALIRALEKGLLAGPLVDIAVLGARAIVHANPGSPLLGGLIDASVRPILALDFDEAMPSVTAAGSNLSGRCTAVPYATAATHFIVPVTKDGVVTSLCSVAADAPGVSIQCRWRADGTPVGMLTLAAVPGELLAEGHVAAAAVDAALDEARIVAAAGLVGIGEQMLDMTVEYLKVRKQFDRLIGSFQAVQHKTVDLYVQKEIGVATLTQMIEEVQAGDRPLPVAALRAKGRASSVATRIARESIQLHGAIGYTEEHDLGLYVKRALTLSAWLGNATAQRRKYIEKGLVHA